MDAKNLLEAITLIQAVKDDDIGGETWVDLGDTWE